MKSFLSESYTTLSYPKDFSKAGTAMSFGHVHFGRWVIGWICNRYYCGKLARYFILDNHCLIDCSHYSLWDIKKDLTMVGRSVN